MVLTGWLSGPAAAASTLLIPVPEEGSPALYSLTCPNGLPAVIQARPGTRTVFVQLSARVGSRDEPPELAGMSHLLEHLIFREGQPFAALRRAGALVNASTDFEQTEYHADLPAAAFDEGIDALAALVSGAAFTAADVDRERRVVRGEAALGKIDPAAVVVYSVLDRIFHGDPIAQPVIGFRRTLNRIRVEDLRDYHRRHYTAANMFAVVVGDVDPARAAGRLCTAIDSLPQGAGTHPPYPEPAARIERMYQFRTLVKQCYLMAGSLTSGAAAPDAPSLELLATLLGDGRGSRLHRRLVRQEAFSDDVLAITFQVSTAGAIAAGLAVNPARAKAARAALLEEMRRLTHEPVPPDELRAAVSRMAGALDARFETNEGIAEFRARRLLLHEPVGRDDYLARLRAITPEKLLEAARRHWGPATSESSEGLIEIQVLPARGFGKLIAALRFLMFRRL